MFVQVLFQVFQSAGLRFFVAGRCIPVRLRGIVMDGSVKTHGANSFAPCFEQLVGVAREYASELGTQARSVYAGVYGVATP